MDEAPAREAAMPNATRSASSSRARPTSGLARSQRQQALEERAVLAKRDAQILGGDLRGLIGVSPLLLQSGALVGEHFGQALDHVCHEAVNASASCWVSGRNENDSTRRFRSCSSRSASVIVPRACSTRSYSGPKRSRSAVVWRRRIISQTAASTITIATTITTAII